MLADIAGSGGRGRPPDSRRDAGATIIRMKRKQLLSRPRPVGVFLIYDIEIFRRTEQSLRHTIDGSWPGGTGKKWRTTRLRNCPLAEQKVVRNMLSRCANSRCGRPFLRLREGKLFVVETRRVTKASESGGPRLPARQERRRVEHYWLCEECAVQWTLVHDGNRGVTLASQRRPIVSEASAARNERNGVAKPA
jgi:hypothetical protein